MTEQERETLRRQAYDIKNALTDLAARLRPLAPEAADAAQLGRQRAFEAWTLLAQPMEEDDHDH